jgi:anti-anti-sigma regulatory factor
VLPDVAALGSQLVVTYSRGGNFSRLLRSVDETWRGGERVTIRLERRPEVSIVQLEGDIDIRCAAELKQALLEALACGTSVQVGLEKTSEVDITTLQLLCAAQQEAKKRRLSFSAGAVPECVCAAIRDAGLDLFSEVAAGSAEVTASARKVKND